MTRMSIDQFRREARGKAAAADEASSRTAAAETEATRRRVECKPAAVAAVWGAAVLDAAFDGFPGRIDLASPNGHNSGLELLRTAEGWRLDGTPDAIRTAATYSVG